MKKKTLKRLFCVLTVVMILTLSVVSAFAGSDTAPIEGMKSLFGIVTETVNIGNVVSAITIGLGIAVGLFFLWWGVRKLIRMAMSAFKKGRVSV